MNAVTMITVITVTANTESFFVWEADWRMLHGSSTEAVEAGTTAPALQTRKLSHGKVE